jgi:hypothetical protein
MWVLLGRNEIGGLNQEPRSNCCAEMVVVDKIVKERAVGRSH